MHINIKYLVLFVNSFALIVIWDYLRIFVQPFTYCGLLVAGAHHWHIFAFIRTIRHQRMCVSEDKDRGKALSAFCWKKSRWKLRLFSSYGPNHCKLWAPGQGHGMLKKCCRLFCVPEDQLSCQRPRATLIFFQAFHLWASLCTPAYSKRNLYWNHMQPRFWFRTFPVCWACTVKKHIVLWMESGIHLW